MVARLEPSLRGFAGEENQGYGSLRGLRSSTPTTECLTGAAFKEPGSFLRPALSFDGTKILFAWCKHYPELAKEKDKLNKANVPEDAFYHVFEMNLDGSGVRQLTHGKYDNFDARYLPDGRIVFLSTRRGQAIQVGKASAAATLAKNDLPDCWLPRGSQSPPLAQPGRRARREFLATQPRRPAAPDQPPHRLQPFPSREIRAPPGAARQGSRGWELCRDPKSGSSAKVFANRSDADYQALLAMVTAGTDFLAEHKRFDMPGFVPRTDWVRELKRYGVLPDEVNPATSATFTPSRRSIGSRSGINRSSRRRRANRTIQRMD